MTRQKSFWHKYVQQRISRRRALQLAVASGGGLALAAACGGDGDEEEVDGEGTPQPTGGGEEEAYLGGILRSAISDPQSKFDAQKFPTFTVQTFASFSYSRLLRSMAGPDDPNVLEMSLPQEDWYRPVPDLAQMPEVVDETTFVFTLQDGAVWHDVPPLNGRAVVPDDVVQSFDYYRSARPDEGVNLNAVDTVAPVGTNQIEVKLSEPFGPFLVMVSSPSDLWIYAPELINDPDTLNSTMIGTGPYVLREYQQAVGAKWDKNPNWWDMDEQGNRLPYTDGLDFFFIPDKNNEISQFSAGRLDTMTVPAELIDALRDQNPDAIISSNIANLLTFLFFPSAAFEADEPPFNDLRVRQAVALALDREALIDLASGGHGGAKHNLMNAGFIWYVDPESDEMGDAAQFFTRDVARAKQLLSDAGYDTLETELHFTNNAYVTAVPYYNPIAEAIPAMLREAGINAKLVTHDYQSEWINPDTGIFYGNLKSGIAYAIETPVPHPWNQLTNQFAPGNVRNHSHINDTEILDLLEQLGQETDFDRGRDLAAQIQKLNAERMYYVPTVGPFGFGARQPYTRAYAAPTSYGIGSESTPRFQINTAEQ
jgi:peptide/nickel transport system substrate-binding protein